MKNGFRSKMAYKARVAGMLMVCMLLLLTAGAVFAETLTLSFLGDCTIGGIDTGGYTSSSFTRYMDKNGHDKSFPFANIAEILLSDDLTIANCEGVFTTGRAASLAKLNLRATADWADAFVIGGVDALNISNNHTKDYGRAGMRDTLAALRNRNLGAFGEGELYVYRVKGITIGMTGYSYPHRFDIRRQTKDIQTLRGQGCDLVIVSMHWGKEGNPTPTKEQRALGPLLIDAGADIVFGHGPHVLQPIEVYQGGVIFYSLANMVFGANSSPADVDTAIAQIVYHISDGIKIKELSVLPASMHVKNNYQPRLYEEQTDKERVYKKMTFKNITESGLPESFLKTGKVISDTPDKD